MSAALLNSGLQAAVITSGQQQLQKRWAAAAPAPRRARRSAALRVLNAIAEPSSAAPKANGSGKGEKLPLMELTAVGPLDGRYGSKVAGLRNSTSEYGLIKARALVEIRWLQMLSQLPEVQSQPRMNAGALILCVCAPTAAVPARLSHHHLLNQPPEPACRSLVPAALSIPSLSPDLQYSPIPVYCAMHAYEVSP